MIILPAIDLFGGEVVRLEQGDYDRKKSYNKNPLDIAKSYKDTGATSIHIVDLEGAKEGHPCHLPILEQIAKLGLIIEWGGGLRTKEAIKSTIESGAARVMAGSLIFKNFDAARDLAEAFGSHIMASVDVKNGRVVHSGWLETTDLTPLVAYKKLREMGFTSFLVTQTKFDGLLSGTDAEFYSPLIDNDVKSGCVFIAAAGGVTNLSDVENLKKCGLSAAVIGKSLYEGRISLQEALAVARR
ncbi:MAG: 1-(5-phosphoribosyl)-5-[(5-phosphoribosylamino)methylideneamino] imidazole-4-carboxamide isomerase [Synergistaceae bacterium]|nr:1-(5-phosphoribosyl)-5-[(5-phosphoribosylamino)methylideneamino] imidazole-4-carboxamide isomerase [Synergistaceae bacterium]